MSKYKVKAVITKEKFLYLIYSLESKEKLKTELRPTDYLNTNLTPVSLFHSYKLHQAKFVEV